MNSQPSGHSVDAIELADAPARRLIPDVLYPKHYVWYVFTSTLDLILTWIILHVGGSEVNALANWVIQQFDLPGVVIFKYSLVLLVITICEIVGRNEWRRGKHLCEWAVGLTFIPVVVALYQLFASV